MAEFLYPVDIGNRALQHCGVPLMDSVTGFSENSKRAQQVSFCYGKLRQAELQRNVWRFAVRKAALRPIDTNTLLLAAALYSSTTTYFVGSIVADQYGTLWISNSRNNLGFTPGPPQSQWDVYFGPLTVMLYDSSTTYFSGELVYTLAGDGTYNTYLSLASSNATHPALPNEWSGTTVYTENQVVRRFPAWASGTTYSAGQGVTYTDGNTYASLAGSNVGNTPSATSTKWATVPTLVLKTQGVPISTVGLVSPPTSTPVKEWLIGSTYSQKDVVMFNGSEYLSIVNSNTGNFPNASGSTSWVSITNGTLYMSLIDLNLGNDPLNAPALWASGTTYAINAQVGASDGLIYKSLGNGNVGNNPTTDGGVHWQSTGVLNPWTTSFTQGGGNQMWMQIGGASFPSGVALTTLSTLLYPIGAGPASQTETLNVYRLPAGYLRKAPQDPGAGSISWLGAPSGLLRTDWRFEGNYIVTTELAPIVLRFLADVQDVSSMHAMFCEGLAARIAVEVMEPLTQSTAKLQMVLKIYEDFMTQARTVNGIEVGAEEPPEDDLIACRL